MLSYRVGENSNFSVYYDPWCNGASLSELIGTKCKEIFNLPDLAKLNSIICNGTWKIPIELKLINPAHYDTILLISIEVVDSIKWKDNTKFNIKILKEQLFISYTEVDWYKERWFKGHALNYNLYCWLAVLKGLKTSDKLATRGLGCTLNCLLCNSYQESQEHLFFECRFSMEIIKNFLPSGKFFLIESTVP